MATGSKSVGYWRAMLLASSPLLALAPNLAAQAQQAAAAASSPLPQPSSKAAPSSAPSSSSDTPSDLAAFMLHRATPQGYVLKGKIQAAVSAKGLSLVKSGPCVWSILLCA